MSAEQQSGGAGARAASHGGVAHASHPLPHAMA